MKRKLRITKEFTILKGGIKLSLGFEVEKFSVSNDLFEDKVNYLIKVNNSPLLIPGEYAEIVYKDNQK